jgi:hypothetical protein
MALLDYKGDKKECGKHQIKSRYGEDDTWMQNFG